MLHLSKQERRGFAECLPQPRRPVGGRRLCERIRQVPRAVSVWHCCGLRRIQLRMTRHGRTEVQLRDANLRRRSPLPRGSTLPHCH